MNARQQILNSFARVMPLETFVERVYVLPRDQGDCILIDWSNETVINSYLNKEQEREITVNVIILSKADKEVAARLDDYSQQVEASLDIDLNGLVDSCDLLSIDQQITAEGERPVGTLTHAYRVRYQTKFNDTTNIIR